MEKDKEEIKYKLNLQNFAEDPIVEPEDKAEETAIEIYKAQIDDLTKQLTDYQIWNAKKDVELNNAYIKIAQLDAKLKAQTTAEPTEEQLEAYIDEADLGAKLMESGD